MKKLDTRRITIITISVFAGTALSALLLYKTQGELSTDEYLSIFYNMLFGFALVIGIAIFLSRQK